MSETDEAGLMLGTRMESDKGDSDDRRKEKGLPGCDLGIYDENGWLLWDRRRLLWVISAGKEDRG